MGGEVLHLFEQFAVVFEEIPDSVFAENAAFEVWREKAAFIVGEVLTPVVAAEVGGEHGNGGLCRLVGVEGGFELLDGRSGLVKVLFHFADSYQLSHDGG